MRGGTERLASKLFVGLLVAIGLVICINATWRALRLLLLLPGLALLVSLVWLLSHWGWIDLADRLQRTLVIEAVLVLVLTTGTTLPAIRYRLAAQMDARSIQSG